MYREKDNTHIEAEELNEHYSNYFNRKGYFPWTFKLRATKNIAFKT